MKPSLTQVVSVGLGNRLQPEVVPAALVSELVWMNRSTALKPTTPAMRSESDGSMCSACMPGVSIKKRNTFSVVPRSGFGRVDRIWQVRVGECNAEGARCCASTTDDAEVVQTLLLARQR